MHLEKSVNVHFNVSNYMPEDLLEIIYILERGEKLNSYKIIQNRNYYSLITKFPANNE